MKNYDVRNLLEDSFVYRIGHIPSALSFFCITKKLKGYTNPLVIGKSFGVQAWFFDDIVRKNFLSQKERKILSVEDFKGSSFNVKYCQQQLGLAAGYSVGYSLVNRKDIIFCLLSDGDVMMKSTLDAIELAFLYSCPIKFIVDYNQVQLFGEKNILPFLKDFECSQELNLTYKPEVVLIPTKKGKGVKQMEERPKDWHYTILTEEQYRSLEFV